MPWLALKGEGEMFREMLNFREKYVLIAGSVDAAFTALVPSAVTCWREERLISLLLCSLGKEI